MYKYGFLYDACFIFLIAFMCEINEVRCDPKDDLPFWTREPEKPAKKLNSDADVQVPRDSNSSRKVYDFRLDDAHVIIDQFFRDILRRTFNVTPANTTHYRKRKKHRKPHVSSEQEEEATSLRKQYPNGVRSSKHKQKRKDKSLSLFRDSSEIINESRKFPKIRNAFNKAFKNKKEYNGLKPSRRRPMQLAQKDDEATTTDKPGAEESTTGGKSSSRETPLCPYGLQNILRDHFIPNFDDVNITMEVLGRTVEYNDILMLRATAASDSKYFRSEKTKYMDEVPEKKIVFIVHGLSVMGFKGLPCLSELEDFSILTSYYFKHLDKFDIFLMPMANPDGVARQRSTLGIRSIWNKNMSPQSACPGVALDRNFDVAWNDSHAHSSCSQLYPGISPFSEAETQAVRDTFHKYSHKIIAYFHVHSGTYDRNNYKGDAVLYPRGFTESQSDDDKYIDLRGEIDEVMKNASFKVFSVNVDTLYSWYGKVAGTSVDYAATVYGIPYAMELVMQEYGSPRGEQHKVLTEVWRRIIDVIFVNIYKASVKAADANDR